MRRRRNEKKRLGVDLHLVIETRRFLELEAVTPTECEGGDKVASMVILVMMMMVLVMVLVMVMVMMMVMVMV